MKFISRILVISSILLGTILPSETVLASDLTVRPFLIDRTAEARDRLSETIVIQNNTESLKYVYATVNEITVDTEGEIKDFVSPVMTDRTNTVTSWIEITRGRIEIGPGEREEVPLTVRVNPVVEPGVYHAFIGMATASNRPLAEQKARTGEAEGVILQITIEDQRTEGMRIAAFTIDRFITGSEDKRAAVEIENIGDITDTPQGEIIFYNARGEEINALDFNTEGETIAPGETRTIVTDVPVDEALGRFKANLVLDYGINQKASLFDSTTFYLMPLHILLIIFFVILSGALLVAFLLRRALVADEYADEDGDDVTMFVKEGDTRDPHDHDINLKQ